jgi:hypothetical protein
MCLRLHQNARHEGNLIDQVLRHAVLQIVAPNQYGHRARVACEKKSSLAGRIAATYNKDALSCDGRCLRTCSPIQDSTSNEAIDAVAPQKLFGTRPTRNSPARASMRVVENVAFEKITFHGEQSSRAKLQLRARSRAKERMSRRRRRQKRKTSLRRRDSSLFNGRLEKPWCKILQVTAPRLPFVIGTGRFIKHVLDLPLV